MRLTLVPAPAISASPVAVSLARIRRLQGASTLPVALAYSCNQFFAGNATRITASALAANLRKFELAAQTPASPEQLALMAIGEWGVLATVIELANAYRRLSSLRYQSIFEGMRAAAEYGTARLAAPAGVAIAGKTGTSRPQDGSQRSPYSPAGRLRRPRRLSWR